MPEDNEAFVIPEDMKVTDPVIDDEGDVQPEPPATAATATVEPDYEAWARDNGYTKAEAVQTPTGKDPRIAQIGELQYTDPEAAEELRLQIAQERAMAAILPTLSPTLRNSAMSGIDVGENGKQYLEKQLGTMDAVSAQAIMSNPVTRDLMTRAARDYEREKTPVTAPRFESASSESVVLPNIERSEVTKAERQFGIKVDKELIKIATEMKAREGQYV